MDVIKTHLNNLCDGVDPWKIVVYSCGTTVIVIFLKDALFQRESLKSRLSKRFFKLVRKLPSIQKRLEEEYRKANIGLEETFKLNELNFVQKLPTKGLPQKELYSELEKYKAMCETDWSSGYVSGCVYSGDKDLTEIMAKTYGMFAWTNPLHLDVFPDIRKMEAEIVRMCCDMFNGDKKSCGVVSSGGTESILLCCLAYRNRAYENGIRNPEMVVPLTAHAAFDKAANYFSIFMRKIDVDPVTGKANIKSMRRAINRNTCMLVGSAPEFPHGIIDPIEEIAELGQKYNIPVHVDACLGGFLIPFMEKAGFPLPLFDFRIPGVTSISADTHKYGFAPKGSSVVLYRNTELRSYQFFSQPDWQGGLYASPTTAGSRPGAIIAACWATLMHIGEDGYVESTRKIINTCRYITEELKKIKEIVVFGDPKVSVIAFDTVGFHCFRLFNFLKERGWILNALQFPTCMHVCLTLLHTKDGVADKFIQDCKEGVKECMKNPELEPEGVVAIYGGTQAIPDRSIVAEMTQMFLTAAYSTDAIVQKENKQNGTL